MNKRTYIPVFILTILITSIVIMAGTGIKTALATKKDTPSIKTIECKPGSSFQTNTATGSMLPLNGQQEKQRTGVSPATKNETTLYTAGNQTGRIGIYGDAPVDNPSDNVFHIYLDDISAIKTAWLVFDLYGVKDLSSVSRSINDGHAIGGAIIQADATWKHQREQIAVKQLKKGDNVIRFSALISRKYGYTVRNVGLMVNTGTKTSDATISLTTVENHFTGDKAYISGHVTGNIPEGNITVSANGQTLYYQNGEFFGTITRSSEIKSEGWNIKITAQNEKGWQASENAHYKQAEATTCTNNLTNTIFSTAIEASPETNLCLKLESASLQLDSASLQEKTVLSISTLREIDGMPVQPGLVNVTGKHSGYRFLPHGTEFKKPVRIGLPYDSALIPKGYTNEDIRTYYFDETRGSWTALPFDTLDSRSGMVYALSTHFTDFINGVIAVPESPETQGYTPTSIKDLSVADPSSGIVQLSPPSANNAGSANIDFPLKTPAGRKGMAPQLAVSYSSAGGDGWIGNGWDLSVPSISVETRWGVPRYNAELETETYLLAGSQLSPLAHRSNWVSRTADKQFYPRIEGAFNRIIRKGNNPANYWWEVTTQSGIRYYYGSADGANVSPAHVLTDNKGNISEWKLAKVIDLNGNTINYTYQSPQYPAAPLSGGKMLYLQRINYTGYNDTPGKYTIDFMLQQEVKTDASIAANYGFLLSDGYLLDRVEIKYDGSPIRSYSFEYGAGAFNKTLLQKITEFDAEGQEFYANTFEYFNETAGGYGVAPSDKAEVINTGEDNLNGPGVLSLAKSTAIGSGGGNTLGAGIYAGFGFGVNVTSKAETVGASYSYKVSFNKDINTLIDLNGDRLPDKVFMDGKALYYRPQLKSGGFGQPHQVSGDMIFQRTVSQDHTIGLSGNMCAYSAAIARHIGRSETKNYFADVNSDGLPDMVKDGRVFYNYIGTDGHPAFTTSLDRLVIPTTEQGEIDTALLKPGYEDWEEQTNENPLNDIVRVWEAPFTGMVTVRGAVSLAETDSAAAYTNFDGVIASIQYRGGVRWKDSIVSPTSPTIDPGTKLVSVTAGNKIYFRLQSRFNGMYDKVNWNPVITYTIDDGSTDVNGLSDYTYTASDDYLLSAMCGDNLIASGEINLQVHLVKPQTTDDVEIEYVLQDTLGNERMVKQLFYAWDDVIDDRVLNTTVAVAKGQTLYARVSSQTNVDWSALGLFSSFFYTASFDPGYSLEALRDTVYPVPDYQSFNKKKAVSTAITGIPANKCLFISPSVNDGAGNVSGNFTFSIKQPGHAPVKKEMSLVNSSLAGDSVLQVLIGQPDDLFIDIHTLNNTVYQQMSNIAHISWVDTLVFGRKQYTSNTDTTYRIGVYRLDTLRPYIQQGDTMFYFPTTGDYLEVYSLNTRTHELEAPVGVNATRNYSDFGPMYRYWGQFSYKSVNDAIDEDDFISKTPQNNDITIDPNGDYDSQESKFDKNPMNEPLIQLYASGKTGKWIGYDTLVNIGRSQMSSSRRGNKELIPYDEYCRQAIEHSSGGRAITKKSKMRGNSVRASAAYGIAGFSASHTNSQTTILTDFTDMNGDGFPDIINESKVQYTSPLGSLSSQTSSFSGDVAYTQNHTSGLGVNNTDPCPKSNTADKKSTPVAIGAGYTNQYTTDDYTMLDINGDGLPDIVHENGNVQLNLGYSFSEPINWGFSGVRTTESVDYDMSIGINGQTSGGGSISAGIDIDPETGRLTGGSVQYSKCAGSRVAGISAAANESHPNLLFADINGDGLADRVRTTRKLNDNYEVVSTGSPTTFVSLNTGAGFAEETPWSNISAFNNNYNINAQLNLAFTWGWSFPIGIVPVKIVLTPSVEAAEDFNKTTESVMDFNGDGYPDYLTSADDNQLTVHYATFGKSNLLKRVNNALGSSFELDYTQKGNTFEMPTRQWALASVTVSDNHTGDGIDNTKTMYEYGQGYYDRYERTFYGYDTLVSKQLDTENGGIVYRKVIDLFANRNYYSKGLMLKEELFDGQGNKFTETENTYMFRNTADNTVTTSAGLPVFSGGQPWFQYVAETKNRYFEGQDQAGKTYRNSFVYSDKGNITTYRDYGDENAGDAVIEGRISYHSNAGRYIYSIPAGIEVLSGGKTYRKRETDIDNAGNITRVRKYVTSDAFTSYDLEYDNYGNITKAEQPENSKGQRMFFEYTYDGQVQAYITKVSDAFGYSSTSEYDYRFGAVLSTRDLNKNPMEFEYDSKGRLTNVTGPKELEAGVEFTIRHSYYPYGEIPWALTEHYDAANPGDFIETAIFCDGLGRAIQTKKDAAIYPDKDVMTVSGHVVYDAFGRVVETYQPITEDKGNTGTFNPNVDPIQPARAVYDAMDRVVKTLLPDNNETTASYGFGQDRAGSTQFTVNTTDPMKNSTTQYTDMRGRQTAVKMPGDIWLSTLYDPVGQALKVTDNDGNITTSTYDLLGRRLERNHPDAGITTWEYDNAGNLLASKPAHILQPITYSYEYNRLTDIIYPDNEYNNVHYEYGGPGAEENRAGRIKLVEDATGAQLFSYGNMGEVVQNSRAVVVPDNGTYGFKTQWKYDSWNRVGQIVYPDGEVVSYTYNSGGSLASMSGKKGLSPYEYVKKIGYDKFGQRTYIGYGNNTQTTYTYDPYRRWLSRLQTTTASGRVIQDNSYAYDAVGNILQLANSASMVTEGDLYGGPITHNYTYDNRYQLKTAAGSYFGKDKEYNYTLEMAYGNTGSILGKSQVNQYRLTDGSTPDWITNQETSYDYTYNYTGKKPHIVTSINNTTANEDYVYQYDASGNNLSADEPGKETVRQILWTEENRIAAIKSQGNVSHYMYDAGGDRILKLHSNSLSISINGVTAGVSEVNEKFTIYPSAYFVVRAGQYTKHYYIEGQRVLTKIGSDNVKDVFYQGSNSGTGDDAVDYTAKQEALESEVESHMSSLGLNWYRNSNGEVPSKYIKHYLLAMELGNKVGSTDNTGYGGSNTDSLLASDPTYEVNQYFVHPDHLGSSSHITDITGEVYQHTEYLPFGEIFVEERNTQQDWFSYLYNGKELDEMTGLVYYGARYLDPRISLWLGVDIMEEKYPGLSPFAYCANNPIILIDPDGMEPDKIKVIGTKETTQTYVNELQKEVPNIKIERDEVSGELKYTGTPVSQNEIKLAEAIDDPTVIAKIEVNNGEFGAFEKGNSGQVLGGAFGGSTTYPDGMVVANQTISLNSCKELEKDGLDKVSNVVIHETLEAYFGGVINRNDENLKTVESSNIDVYGQSHMQAGNQGQMLRLIFEDGRFKAIPARIDPFITK